MSDVQYRCEQASSAHAAGLLALFEASGNGCYCNYWHFTGDKNAWLERCFITPELNANELAAALQQQTRAAPVGIVLREQPASEVIGWMKLSPQSAVPKLYDQRPYRALPGLRDQREGIFTVGCFLIDPAWRRRGLCSLLLDEGIALARSAGARALEAFPRRAELMRDEEIFSGPFSVFARKGFEIVHDSGPYPVLRLTL